MSEKDRCDYCGRLSKDVPMLIEGPISTEEINDRPVGTRTFICSNCVEICQTMVQQDMRKANKVILPKLLPTPKEIVAFLDKFIIGQDQAKRNLAVAVSNHYKRLKDQSEDKKKKNEGDYHHERRQNWHRLWSVEIWTTGP